jgi:hypothetical protein
MGTSRRAASVASCAALLILSSSLGWAALTVPTDVQQPGTQPGEAGALESPDKCNNCHGNYNRAVEPGFNWRGSMMANAGRDPLFWATLAIAEQDFDGVGDLCIRCHSTAGWQAGRSTPTDGSALTASDADGVECEACHKSTNTDNNEHLGAQSQPFVANDGPGKGYYGSGMLSLWSGAAKLGPYANADARHQFLPSKFHRDVAFCGTCHDVSNPAVGNLAHNNGRQPTSEPIVADGTPGGAVDGKAAFNNLPFRYGVVERTFSEFMSGSLGTTRVAAYASLPTELQAGAIKAAYESAKGDYADGAPRYFSCQTCHMRAVTGQGCNKAGVLTRTDLPLHDMTGGNYWAPDAIAFQNANGTLRLGGGLTTVQLDALAAGKSRALQQLGLAATLTVTGNTLKIVNLTGHKLISGYPEGRRMWVNVRWFDASGALLREDGRYGGLTDPANNDAVVVATGKPVRTLIDPYDPNTKVYEAHHGMTQQWAQQLMSLGYAASMPLTFNRYTGAVEHTLGELAGGTLGAQVETFHFVLNNVVVKDNRIPPYGFSYETARQRNALPVPASQYAGLLSGTYNHFDTLALAPPSNATYAAIRLMYQSTSWEYVQFLVKANNKANAFLANEGDRLLDAWLATGQAEPQVMATATWGSAPAPACATPGAPQTLTAASGRRAITLSWKAAVPPPNGGYRVHYNQSGKLQFRGSVPAGTLTYKDSGLTSRVSYAYVVTAWQDCNGNGTFDAGTDIEGPVSNTASATAG